MVARRIKRVGKHCSDLIESRHKTERYLKSARGRTNKKKKQKENQKLFKEQTGEQCQVKKKK